LLILASGKDRRFQGGIMEVMTYEPQCPATSGLPGNKRISRAGKVAKAFFLICCVSFFGVHHSIFADEQQGGVIDLGFSAEHYRQGKIPDGWTLRGGLFRPKTRGAQAFWVKEDGVASVKLHSKDALTFLEKTVDIDIKEYPVVSWKWKVENVLSGIDERTPAGDDHPIRLFFVFAPDESKQSLWFRLKRFLYLDRVHGHPMGGRFTEYLWSSHLKAGDILPDPKKPWQKLMVIEGGRGNLGKWLIYRKNLYTDFKMLYREEPNHLIFVGILNDTDATGQEAVSYIADLFFQGAENTGKK